MCANIMTDGFILYSEKKKKNMLSHPYGADLEVQFAATATASFSEVCTASATGYNLS